MPWWEKIRPTELYQAHPRGGSTTVHYTPGISPVGEAFKSLGASIAEYPTYQRQTQAAELSKLISQANLSQAIEEAFTTAPEEHKQIMMSNPHFQMLGKTFYEAGLPWEQIEDKEGVKYRPLPSQKTLQTLEEKAWLAKRRAQEVGIGETTLAKGKLELQEAQRVAELKQKLYDHIGSTQSLPKLYYLLTGHELPGEFLSPEDRQKRLEWEELEAQAKRTMTPEEREAHELDLELKKAQILHHRAAAANFAEENRRAAAQFKLQLQERLETHIDKKVEAYTKNFDDVYKAYIKDITKLGVQGSMRAKQFASVAIVGHAAMTNIMATVPGDPRAVAIGAQIIREAFDMTDAGADAEQKKQLFKMAKKEAEYVVNSLVASTPKGSVGDQLLSSLVKELEARLAIHDHGFAKDRNGRVTIVPMGRQER